MTEEQKIWCCQVSWNLGVIHARAEDFSNAQYCFKWCCEFKSDKCSELNFKSSFYYLTAKMCETDTKIKQIDQDDFVTLDSLTESSQYEEYKKEIICLKIEIFLKAEKWTELESLLLSLNNSTEISYETLAEIVLSASVEIPLKIYHSILLKLTEREFDSSSFDIIKFSKLFRGMITCSLLQYPSDLSHFHSAVKVIKSSFGAYPDEEIIWLCGTSLEMGREAAYVLGDWNKGAEWIEMAMNIVYLIPDGNSTKKDMKESVNKYKYNNINNLFLDTRNI